MKTIVTGILIFLSMTVGAQKVIDFSDFVNDYRGQKGVVTFSFGGQLISKFLDDNNQKTKTLMNKTDYLTFFVLEERNADIIDDFKTRVMDNSYRDLMIVQEGGAKVNFKIKTAGELIDEILMIADDSQSFTIMCWKGKFTMDEARKLTESVNVGQSLDFGAK